MKKSYRVMGAGLLAVFCLSTGFAQSSAQQPLLTVKEIMNAIITPATTTIWGAYQLETEAQWEEVSNAALSVIAAGNLLQFGGAGAGEATKAMGSDWQNYNQQMIDAARQVIAATQGKDEEALSAVGNDALYPPCESCHQQYQAR